MAKRIFFAFPLDDALRSKIITWENEFKKKYNLPVRWIEPRNLHITLIPPWSVEESRIEFLKGLLLPAISRTISFEIECNTIQFGPSSRLPKLMWATGPTPAAMQELKNELERILKNADISFQPTREPFMLHISLAHFHAEEFSSFPIQELSESVRFFGVVSSVVLMQSILGFEGAEYKTLHHYLLKEK